MSHRSREAVKLTLCPPTNLPSGIAARLLHPVNTPTVVGAGFPAGLAWLLGTARKEQLLDTAFHATWGFLFDGYRTPTRKLVQPPGGNDGSGGSKVVPVALRPSRRNSLPIVPVLSQAWVAEGDSRVWWEALVLCRKAGVVMLAVLVTNPYAQCVGATLWFFGAVLLQLQYAPYAQAKFNRLELATLTATFITAVISTALLQYNVDLAAADLHPPAAMSPIEWTVTIALVLINMGMLLTLGFLWLHVQWKRARSIARHIPRPRSLSWSRSRRSTSGGIASFAGSGSNGGSAGSAGGVGGTLDGDSDVATVVTTANPLRPTSRTSGADGGAPAALSTPTMGVALLSVPSRRIMVPVNADGCGGMTANAGRLRIANDTDAATAVMTPTSIVRSTFRAAPLPSRTRQTSSRAVLALRPFGS